MQKPTFKEALKFWAKLGFISFGGSAGQIGIMHEYLVDKKKWISESKFLHALNYCMILPGPEAQQLATYMGWLLHGVRGGLAAGILFILPSVFILLGLSITYVSYGSVPVVYSVFNGLKPAVIAIVILALVKIGSKSLLGPFHYFIALTAFVALYFFHISFPVVLIGAALLALLAKQFLPGIFSGRDKSKTQAPDNEEQYCINKHTVVPNIGFNPLRLGKLTGAVLLLWLLPLTAFYFLSGDFPFWKKLSLFFTQAALVTFGGAYAVLPYVAQVSVEKFNWLTNLQMIDGLALGETTPGPLIMVLAFVGFMAGHNHFGSSLAAGTLALVATTFYTFLPSFFFIFAGAPVIERTHENKSVKEIFSIITAAVVGVVLNLSIYLGKAVLFPASVSIALLDYASLIWAVVSLLALYRFKVNILAWIAASALFGLARYLLSI